MAGVVARPLRRTIVMIQGLTNADALPTLERVIQFAGARHRLIAHNIANLTTPRFEAVDAPVDEFQAELTRAIDARRERFGGHRGELDFRSTRHIKVDGRRAGSGLEVEPASSGRNVMFHDRNNRDLERTMQDLAENVAVFRMASELHKHATNQLRTAISERI